MTPPTLTLPPPAGTLWHAIGETVREELRSISDRQTQYAIGGGSILAARWKHRYSYDIDLVVQPDTPLGMLAEANNPAAAYSASRADPAGVTWCRARRASSRCAFCATTR